MAVMATHGWSRSDDARRLEMPQGISPGILRNAPLGTPLGTPLGALLGTRVNWRLTGAVVEA